jgi:hypothetical protein
LHLRARAFYANFDSKQDLLDASPYPKMVDIFLRGLPAQIDAVAARP